MNQNKEYIYYVLILFNGQDEPTTEKIISLYEMNYVEIRALLNCTYFAPFTFNILSQNVQNPDIITLYH